MPLSVRGIAMNNKNLSHNSLKNVLIRSKENNPQEYSFAKTVALNRGWNHLI